MDNLTNKTMKKIDKGLGDTMLEHKNNHVVKSKI